MNMGLRKNVLKRKGRGECVIKRGTKRSWDVLDAVTSWQERSKDLEQT